MRLDPGQIEVIDDEMAAVFRRMTGAQRLQIASDLFSSTRRMLLSHLRFEHPDWDDEKLTREVAHRMSHGAI